MTENTAQAAGCLSHLTAELGMTSDRIQEKLKERIEEEKDHEEFYLWMSFCNLEMPKGKQFLGVIITKTKGLAHAIKKTHELGINPSGQISSYAVDGDEIKKEHLDKLLTKENLIEYGYIDA